VKFTRWLPLLLVAVILVACGSSSQRRHATYSTLIQYTKQHRVQLVVFRPTRQEIDATLNNGTKITVNYPTNQAAVEYQNVLSRTRTPFVSSP
jgi:hypothetical protein